MSTMQLLVLCYMCCDPFAASSDPAFNDIAQIQYSEYVLAAFRAMF